MILARGWSWGHVPHIRKSHTPSLLAPVSILFWFDKLRHPTFLAIFLKLLNY